MNRRILDLFCAWLISLSMCSRFIRISFLFKVKECIPLYVSIYVSLTLFIYPSQTSGYELVPIVSAAAVTTGVQVLESLSEFFWGCTPRHESTVSDEEPMVNFLFSTVTIPFCNSTSNAQRFEFLPYFLLLFAKIILMGMKHNLTVILICIFLISDGILCVYCSFVYLWRNVYSSSLLIF